MTPNQLPPAEYLRKAFSYCPKEGILRWNHRDDVPAATNTRFAGKVVGSPHINGLMVRLNGIPYSIHRIIYVMMTNIDLSPNDEVDHIDGCVFNNEWSNLRKVTHQQNMFNKGAQCNSPTGVKGVDILPGGTYRVRISGLHIGCYNTIDEAIKASNAAIEKLHGEHGRLTLLR